jgi:ACS family hexuronate transporter-like MFS transporter
LHPFTIFVMAGFAYVSALVIFHLLVPRLGARIDRDLPVQPA